MTDVNTNANVTENPTPETEVTENPTTEAETTSTPTIEELMSQLAQERAEKEKLRTSLTNSNSEAAKYKKALREKQTAEEQETEAKAEQDEQRKKYVESLELFKKTAEAKARYALQGMNEELSSKAADAEVTGDMDALAKIQKQHTDELLKLKEAEWIKSRPQPQTGTSSNDDEDAFIKAFNSVTPRFKR